MNKQKAGEGAQAGVWTSGAAETLKDGESFRSWHQNWHGDS